MGKKQKELFDPEEEEILENALLDKLRSSLKPIDEELEVTQEGFEKQIEAYYQTDKPQPLELKFEEEETKKETVKKRRGIITKAEILRNQNEKRKVFKSTLHFEREKLSYFKKPRPMPLAKSTLPQDFAMDVDFLTRIKELREEEQRVVREKEKAEKLKAKMSLNSCRNSNLEKVDVMSLAREALKW